MDKFNHNGWEDASLNDGTDLPNESRYRTSEYFHNDRLRCSQAAQDLHDIKQLMQGLQDLNLGALLSARRPKLQPALQPIRLNQNN